MIRARPGLSVPSTGTIHNLSAVLTSCFVIEIDRGIGNQDWQAVNRVHCAKSSESVNSPATHTTKRDSMNSYKVSTDDAALLEEVAIFLDTSGLLLPAVDNEPLLGNEAQAGSSGSDSGERSDKSLTGRAAARREKEILRKRRYQRRLKDERETLRQMEQELSSKLAKLEEAHRGKMLSATNKLARINSVWRNLVKQERERRSQAEREQKRLIEAVTVQASYLANLRELLPGQVEIGGDTAMAMAIDASEKGTQNAQIVCSMDLVV